MFFANYLKFIGLIELIGWVIGLFFIMPFLFSGGITTPLSVIYALLYIIFGPALGITFFAVGYLLRLDAESSDE